LIAFAAANAPGRIAVRRSDPGTWNVISSSLTGGLLLSILVLCLLPLLAEAATPEPTSTATIRLAIACFLRITHSFLRTEVRTSLEHVD